MLVLLVPQEDPIQLFDIQIMFVAFHVSSEFSSAKGMVLLAALSCIRFYGKDTPPAQLPAFEALRVNPDGLCFWSCLYLAQEASPARVLGWYSTPRLSNDAASGDEGKRQTEEVRDFALKLDEPQSAMPRRCRRRVITGESANISDIEPWFVPFLL